MTADRDSSNEVSTRETPLSPEGVDELPENIDAAKSDNSAREPEDPTTLDQSSGKKLSVFRRLTTWKAIVLEVISVIGFVLAIAPFITSKPIPAVEQLEVFWSNSDLSAKNLDNHVLGEDDFDFGENIVVGGVVQSHSRHLLFSRNSTFTLSGKLSDKGCYSIFWIDTSGKAMEVYTQETPTTRITIGSSDAPEWVGFDESGDSKFGFLALVVSRKRLEADTRKSLKSEMERVASEIQNRARSDSTLGTKRFRPPKDLDVELQSSLRKTVGERLNVLPVVLDMPSEAQ